MFSSFAFHRAIPITFLVALCVARSPNATAALLLSEGSDSGRFERDTLLVVVDTSRAVFLRVIDTGPGLAVVARAPGGYYLVYDTGHWSHDERVLAQVRSVVPEGEEIDLMVLSHSDSDHLAAADEIFDAYAVRRVIHTGRERLGVITWEEARDAIAEAVASGETAEVNLRDCDLPPGATYRLGEAFVTIVSGFHDPPQDWEGLSSDSKRRNAVSLAVRLYYEGRSVLITGDAVGRLDGAAPDADPIATERFMLGNLPLVTLQSDVLVAPHHGADNASAQAFIEAVDPLWVVFSARHAHEHPRSSTALRYLSAGVPLDRLLRTDLGDDEGEDEWPEGRTPGSIDPEGDDDIDIWLTDTRNVWVQYSERL
jgi:beta-lactamase superfamily II metal-dependent hydrolase